MRSPLITSTERGAGARRACTRPVGSASGLRVGGLNELPSSLTKLIALLAACAKLIGGTGVFSKQFFPEPRGRLGRLLSHQEMRGLL